MKTFIKTLLVAVTILFSVFATAKQVKLPNNIKYVNTTEAFSCTEIDGMNCQTKRLNTGTINCAQVATNRSSKSKMAYRR